MREIAAREAKNQLGRFLDAAQSAPVQVTKKGRPVAVMMSQEQFERLRGAAWDRLQVTIDVMRAEAKANGLTEKALANLLRDEQ